MSEPIYRDEFVELVQHRTATILSDDDLESGVSVYVDSWAQPFAVSIFLGDSDTIHIYEGRRVLDGCRPD